MVTVQEFFDDGEDVLSRHPDVTFLHNLCRFVICRLQAIFCKKDTRPAARDILSCHRCSAAWQTRHLPARHAGTCPPHLRLPPPCRTIRRCRQKHRMLSGKTSDGTSKIIRPFLQQPAPWVGRARGTSRRNQPTIFFCNVNSSLVNGVA